MKTKKIIAATLAVATATTMAVTASAASKTFWFDTTGNVYGGSASKNVIHYSELSMFEDTTIKYETVEKDMMEGNKILTVDFSQDPTAKRKKIESWVKSCVDDYMENLNLKNSWGADVSGKYALEVLRGNSSAQYDVMVVPGYRLTSNFDITSVSLNPYYGADGKSKASTDTAWLTVKFKINNGHILIDEYDIDIDGCNSNRKFTRNLSDFYTEDAYTTGTASFLVPLKYAGTTRTVTINGTKVGTVTLPKLSSNFHIGCDRYISNLNGTYKNY